MVCTNPRSQVSFLLNNFSKMNISRGCMNELLIGPHYVKNLTDEKLDFPDVR